ncbi:MAG: DUF2207 domain-containing protein [Endomicrobia bacterium]|nr:DUF2207 domain-containing protein [Endomicrobiia bacterium]
MKKFILPLFSAALIFAFAGSAFAEERIINFASSMQIRQDGSAIVEEIITVNAEHVKIRRGLYRDIPDKASEPVEFISLFMDNEPHPSFTEHPGGNLRINFGNDDYISKGMHTYKLTYSIANVVRDFEDYDEVYWNVTGNDWDFPIERASFSIFLPQGAEIKDELVSTYTGRKGSKTSHAQKTGRNFFATTKTLYAGEGFTVAVPFEKGFTVSHKKGPLADLSLKHMLIAAAGAILFVLLLIYFIVSWYAVGKDPKDTIVTEFSPPAQISPAFMRSLWKRSNDKKMFAAALVSLAMKNKIEIAEEKVVFVKTAVLKIKDRNTDNLPEEEKYIIETLFSSKDEFQITRSNWSELSSCMNHIERGFNIERKKYIVSNKKYIIPSVIALIVFQLLFIPFGGAAAGLIFINLHYCVFFLVCVGVPQNKVFKIIAFICINLFYFPFFFFLGRDAGIAAIAVECFFLLSLWMLPVYIGIIDNLTEEGRELFKGIKGFYRYMTVAETNRVAMSIPVDDEKIFADYLPYAFAFDMENKWMKRFEKILSEAVIERCTHNIGGRSALAGLGGGLLVSSINSAAPKSSGSSGSGSSGGGSSGGGSGGGGGGGR